MPQAALGGHASETNLKSFARETNIVLALPGLVPTAFERHSSRLVPFHLAGEPESEKVIRSDVRKLTACREVAGL